MLFAANIVSPTLTVLILTTIAVSTVEAGPLKNMCSRNPCKKIRCDPLGSVREKCSAKKGIFEEKGGWCQCCPVCIKRLYEDQNCSISLNLQLPVRAKCTEGLECSVKYRRCVRPVVKVTEQSVGNDGSNQTITSERYAETVTPLPTTTD